MKYLEYLACVLVVLGAINWGCIGFFNWNLIGFFFQNDVVERVIYAAVGVAGVHHIIFHWILQKGMCKKK